MKLHRTSRFVGLAAAGIILASCGRHETVSTAPAGASPTTASPTTTITVTTSAPVAAPAPTTTAAPATTTAVKTVLTFSVFDCEASKYNIALVSYEIKAGLLEADPTDALARAAAISVEMCASQSAPLPADADCAATTAWLDRQAEAVARARKMHDIIATMPIHLDTDAQPSIAYLMVLRAEKAGRAQAAEVCQ
jgi:post-segregation antitoxin (ccd killing protein)